MIVAPGVYSVPDEIGRAEAEMAIQKQVATKIDLPWTKPPMMPVPPLKRRGRARKGPAENKLMTIAENK